MKFAFLPNYFKKIGMICFFSSLVVIIIAGIVATVQASVYLNDAANSYQLGLEVGRKFASTNYWVIQIGGVLLLLSMAFYMLAKEKVDDEYMDAIRWESLRLAIIISIGITILCILLHVNMTAKNILLIQFISYLVTFKIKRSI